MKVIMDWDLCQGHGVCEGEAPEVFRLDDDGMLEVLDESPDESLRPQVEKAVRYCPQRAIRLSEDD